ncbi:uncharacterized protein A1O9_05792 [Exophiala aquamarina CBS 119918]|uniref:Uncharacterized protein n=1 Tax=Exophiala aquamarina CBS 119918 TaxID=1182545 RepID=A0A072PDD5_9EURO|nr:uncharacterized protein A1O9_05792 [Exophiala aquamarina CBS 119918]KEF57871.1 hypothetical protein A1O9_05792 [Exophiala aquamarina CBS 119918]
MIPIILALASGLSTAFAQACPDGYALNTGTLPQNQTLDWLACPVEEEPTLECATLLVPIDYNDPDAGLLTLPLVRIPSNSSNAKSIIWNPGGPGVSGITSLIGNGASTVLLAGGDYNVLTFDPRGTGFTIPYQCPTVDSAEGSEVPLDDPIGLNASFVTNTNQGELCGQDEYKLGGELVGTAFVARDVDSIAQALGEDGMIRYWGFSYGTLLGSTIAAMFPEKIDRMILDGNINPTDYYHGTNEESVDNVDAALLNFFETCAEAGPTFCPLADATSTGQELHDAFLQILEQVKSGELILSGTTSSGSTVEVGYKELKSLFFSALRGPRNFPEAAETLAILLQGASGGTSRVLRRDEFDPLAAQNLEYDQALSAITCGDWDDIDGTLDDFEKWLGLYLERSQFGGDQLISILYGCATWRVNAREKYDGLFTGIETNTPILFINGPFDPVTPFTSAQNSSSGFTNSALLQTMGAGHCSTAQPSTCVQLKVASYFQTGQLPDVSEICQPNQAAFSGAIIPSTNSTGPVTNSTEGRGVDDDFSAAVANLVNMFDKRDVEYPAMLLEMKRDVKDILRARQASSATNTLIPATCTPTAGGAQSTGSGSSGSDSGGSGSENGAPQLLSNKHIWSVLTVLCISWLGLSI